MSKGMETLLLRAPKGDPCQPAPIRDNVVQIVVFPERTERRVHFEEYLPVCRLGVARLQVVDQGLADPVSQTQSQRRARFPCVIPIVESSQRRLSSFPPRWPLHLGRIASPAVRNFRGRLSRNLSFSFAPCFLRRGAVSRLKLSSLESSGSEIRFSPSPR